jgi:hypothetical protein
MNANELADELDNLPSEYLMEEWMYKAQAMLREQQAEIEALKAENQFFKDIMGDVQILRKAQEK